MERPEKLEGFGATRVIDGAQRVYQKKNGLEFWFPESIAGKRDAKCCSIQARRSNNRAVTSRLRAENNTFRNFSSSNCKSLYV